MLKVTNPEGLDYPFLASVAVCNEYGFMVIQPVTVFSIIVDGSMLFIANNDGMVQSLEYSDPQELSKDYDALRTRIMATAEHCNLMIWDTARWSDSPAIAMFNPVNITSLRLYPALAALDDTYSITLSTRFCTIMRSAPRAAVDTLRDEILAKQFPQSVQTQGNVQC